MDWRINLKQRDRIALALSFIFLVIVLANWFMNYSVKQISGNFKSVYEDRLVPALDIAAITERSYQNHILLEEQLLTADADRKQMLSKQIRERQFEVDSILAKFETTYLTKTEYMNLEKYKLAQKRYKEIQEAILKQTSYNPTEHAKLANKEKVAFKQLLEPLHALSKIQEIVGHDLLNSAERQVNGIKLLSYLVIAMAVIIAVLVTTLLLTSQRLNTIKPQNYSLN